MTTAISNKYDGDDGNSSGSCSWSSATNWTVAGGSLDAFISFESSDSPIDYETDDAEKKPNLILKSPSPDCGPCEIKINFTQMHEVRQVYIRSTARVYEIYFAPSLQSSNEYLCTVRCSIATRDGEVLHATGAEELLGAHSNGLDGERAKEKCSNDGNISLTLDDWIEVKVPDAAFQDNHPSSMTEKIDANRGISVQDFYEATAEITDADACTSLTIRLLSLQSKGCLYVDEIYVFADPVESDDSETPASQVANSTGSSLMAMLVPTLLQLSRTGNSQRQDRHDSDTSEKGVTESTNIACENQPEESIASQQDVKLQNVNEATPEPPKFQITQEVSDIEERNHFVAKTDMSYDRIERTLEKLVSRVSRIEDILLTFEENMLKPICSMETRLQRVEQHVEMLTKNSQSSGTRISAPEFSCNGSNSSSFYNEGDAAAAAACGEFELEKKDTPSDKCSNPPDDTSIPVNDMRYRPSLVVTAPEFSCGDDDENSDATQLPEEIPKQALSIDDALAAALAGFLSTTIVQSSHYSPTLTVQAPEFTIEENSGDGKVVSPSAQSDKPIAPTMLSCESIGKECINDSVSSSSHTSSILFMEQVMENSDEISGVDGQDIIDEGGTSCSSLGTSVNYPTTKIELEFGQTDYCQIAESASVCERSEILKHVNNQTEDMSASLREGAEDVVDGSEKDTFRDVFKPSSAATFEVDFELPILDVKFDYGETSGTKSPLEALLTDMPEFKVETPPVDEFLIGEQNNLILLEDGEPNSPMFGHLLFVGCDSYDGSDAPSSMEGEAPQYSHTSNEQEMYVSLI